MAEIRIVKPKLLVVEGVDEKIFFEKIFERAAIDNVQVLPIGGKTQIRDNLKALTYVANFHAVASVGVIRDADGNPSGAFQSVCDALGNAGLPIPSAQVTVASGPPKISILILPKPDNTGMLEDVCLESIEKAPEMECIDNYFECIQEKIGRQPGNMSKAKVYAYIAAKEPELRLGEAAKRGLFDLAHPAFNQITTFLCAL